MRPIEPDVLKLLHISLFPPKLPLPETHQIEQRRDVPLAETLLPQAALIIPQVELGEVLVPVQPVDADFPLHERTQPLAQQVHRVTDLRPGQRVGRQGRPFPYPVQGFRLDVRLDDAEKESGGLQRPVRIVRRKLLLVGPIDPDGPQLVHVSLFRPFEHVRHGIQQPE